MSNLPIIETINTNIANFKNAKQNIKNTVNTDYDFINNEQIESYPDLIKQGIAYYKNRVPHATKEGTDLSFNAVPLKFENMTIKGNTEQASTSIASGDEYDSPSPEHPQDIHVVTGENAVVINGKNFLDNKKISQESEKSVWTYIPKGTYYVKRFRLSSSVNDEFNSKLYYKNKNDEEVVITTKDNDNGNIILNGTDFGWYSSSSTGILILKKDYYIRCFGLNKCNMMVSKDSNITSYEPYVEPRSYPLNLGNIELCKIGDYQDYLYKENGNWYKYGAIGKVILDGTQNISLQSINDYNIANFLITFSENYYDLSKYQQMLVDKFSKQTTSVSITQAEGFLPTLNSNSHVLGVYLRIKSSTANTTNSMNVWLSIHNTTVYYVLDTPTITQITDTTLISQLNALDKAKGNNGTTIITTSSDDLAPILNFTAYLKEVE